ncbi:MAG: peptide chain release factor N(5)-glutamine methyltransferase [Candidatus Moranbacteria bacterium]|nr:peptide chain release factor N(5)-glutamine methyltransferase [Candidatus Moranbacteria bacterium]
MTIQETLRKACSKYKLSPLDAEIILSLAGNMPKVYILAHPEKKLSPAQIKKYHSFAKRRSASEPIAYIAGKKEFFGLDFVVNKNVLIPRPETELLVEHAIERILNTKCGMPDVIIDVGTGSGNIIVSIAKNIPNKIKNKINFYAVDISKKSLEVAKKNAKKNKTDKNIKFIQSDLLEYFPLLAEKNKKIKNILIIANLPYVSSKIYHVNKNNLKFEPKNALISENNGLNHYKDFFKQLRYLSYKCYMLHVICFVEFSPEQKSEISRIITRYLPKAKSEFFKDLAGKWRMAELSF